jgi:PPOX class probable F420-dependent enzyme
VVPGGRGEDRDLLTDPLASELLAAPLIANLATLNRDGSIHLVAMWFLWRDGAVLIPTSHSTRKARNLARDPRATVMIDDSRGGFDLRGITLFGRAELVTGAEALELNREIHRKYVEDDGLALDAVRSYLSSDDVTVRFRPERVSSWDLRATEQGRALAETGLYRPLA